MSFFYHIPLWHLDEYFHLQTVHVSLILRSAIISFVEIAVFFMMFFYLPSYDFFMFFSRVRLLCQSQLTVGICIIIAKSHSVFRMHHPTTRNMYLPKYTEFLLRLHTARFVAVVSTPSDCFVATPCMYKQINVSYTYLHALHNSKNKYFLFAM